MRTSTVVFLVIACVVAISGGVAGLAIIRSPIRAPTVPHAAAERYTYTSHVRKLDAGVDYLTARTRAIPNSYLTWESLANIYRSRALFTGTHLDLQRAAEAMNHSFSVAEPGCGPFLSRAKLNATLHRYPLIEADLTAAEQGFCDQKQTAGIVAVRASGDFYCGRYEQALSGFARAVALDPSSANLLALADACACTGDWNGAIPLLDQVYQGAANLDPVTQAWVITQLGTLAFDRGCWDEAERRYREAASILPGWWMVELRIAELDAKRGNRELAIASYESLVKRTGKPEAMDALSLVLHEQGCDAEASRWSTTARTAYDALLADQPEAAYGHALDHFLLLEHEPELTISLAERNHDLRPGGESSTKLAQAYLLAGRVDDARAVIDRLVATPWDTATAHATAAKVYQASGESVRASSQRSRARLIDPHL